MRFSGTFHSVERLPTYQSFGDDFSETSLRNYHSTLRNIPQECRSHVHAGGSLKTCRCEILQNNCCGIQECIKQSNPITGLDRSRGFQKVKVPTFNDNRHMKVVRLSALRTGRLDPRN